MGVRVDACPHRAGRSPFPVGGRWLGEAETDGGARNARSAKRTRERERAVRLRPRPQPPASASPNTPGRRAPAVSAASRRSTFPYREGNGGRGHPTERHGRRRCMHRRAHPGEGSFTRTSPPRSSGSRTRRAPRSPSLRDRGRTLPTPPKGSSTPPPAAPPPPVIVDEDLAGANPLGHCASAARPSRVQTPGDEARSRAVLADAKPPSSSALERDAGSEHAPARSNYNSRLAGCAGSLVFSRY